MAEKTKEGRKMSRNISSENVIGEESCITSTKTSGRKSGDKPQIELYRPQTGMTLRRADGQSWRNSKSPSPCTVDSFSKICQVNQTYGKSKNFNKKFDSRISADTLPEPEPNFNKNNIDNVTDLRNLSISVENGGDEIHEPTSRSSEDKKKTRKPEKAIYVPKPILQTEKDARNHQRKQQKSTEINPLKSEEDDWDEPPKNTPGDQKKKRKPKGRGRPRDDKEPDEKEYSQPYKEENNRKQVDSTSVHKQASLDSSRFQIDHKNDKRNYPHKRHDDKKRDNIKSSMRKSTETLDYPARADSPEFVRGHQNFNVKTDKRDFRQNSEPRIIPHATSIRPNLNNSSTNRLRDTRSMEHSNWPSEKVQSKPPAGRRGSGNVPLSKQATFDSLPPRLKKKYMEEKGMTVSLPSNSYIGTSSEEQWDGGSLSFLNNSSSNYMVQQYQMPHSNYQHYQNYPSQQWPQKMSSPKGRGRGRMRPDDTDMDVQPMDQGKVVQPDFRSPSGSRCNTPFKNVSQSHENISHDRSVTFPSSLPPRSFSSHDQVGPYDDRYYDYDSHASMRYQRDGRKTRNEGRTNQWKESKTLPRRNQSGRNSYSERQPRTRKLSNASTASNVDLDLRDMKSIPEPHPVNCLTPPEDNSVPVKCTSPRTLDWSEEVEEPDRPEREAISRSSSVASLSNIHSSREKRKHRRRGGKKERSLSRESGRGYRNTSTERHRNMRRQSDENVYRPASRDQNKGLYRFHRNISRESSGDREPKSEILDWRRGGDQEKNDKDWRRGDVEKVDKDWRKEKEKLWEDKEDKGSWREDKKKECHMHSDPSVPPSGMQPVPTYQQRGFIQLQQQQLSPHQQPQRQLFDPSNPNKPIIVNSLNSRVTNSVNHGWGSLAFAYHSRYQDKPPRFSSLSQYPSYHYQNGTLGDGVPGLYHKDSSSNRPSWYDHEDDSFRTHKNPILLLDIQRADTDLQYILRCTKGPVILSRWSEINYVRQFLQKSLQILLISEIKFCQEENVEQHMWKITYYNLIETLRKSMNEDPENKEAYKNALLSIVDEGAKYFERLIQLLEENYNFKVDTFLALSGDAPKGLGYTGLALVSTQKIMLFLGDLARYREVANDSNNYGKSKQWYSKAQQLNPKNGRPYYQLALLAYLARRKLDAVYYYMRSLMASNPLKSAKESLVSLFDENRKKYEQIEKKKKEDRESKYKEKVKEKEGSSLRREIWVHPSGRRRVHRTTSTSTDSRRPDSEDEELLSLESTDINKRFTTSYLHVHGKLFTKVGMETFQDAGLQMLREFRALLRQTPLPIGCTRFLQLLALNMFAVENTQLKDNNLEPGYRSAVQENALIISLQMFNLILEKCVNLLRDQLNNPPEMKNRLVVDDVEVLLPAIKVWCDWLTCHVDVWNPPPNCSEYRVGPPGDAWNRLALLVNLLEKLDHRKTVLATSHREGLEMVRLPEDAALTGFTPLILNEQSQIYTSTKNDMELAQCVFRIRKILFVGTVFLCGMEPPVLKLQKYDNYNEYVSVVDNSGHSQSSPTDDQSDTELVVESFSEEECDDHLNNSEEKRDLETPLLLDSLEMATSPSAVETRRLLIRKEELEKKHQRQERHRKRVQAILQQSGLSVVIEVKPKYLVPDTNCFIDYLELLKKIATSCAPGMEPYYILTIPFIVLNELEGLARGGRDRDISRLSLTEQEHAADVSGSARAALTYLRSPVRSLPTIRCVTTRGQFINSFTTFVFEDDVDRDLKNDDKVLATCISLCRNSGKEQNKPGDPRHLVREVVLLTEDRNLRVKALARDVPVREVPDFAQWAGLG